MFENSVELETDAYLSDLSEGVLRNKFLLELYVPISKGFVSESLRLF